MLNTTVFAIRQATTGDLAVMVDMQTEAQRGHAVRRGHPRPAGFDAHLRANLAEAVHNQTVWLIVAEDDLVVATIAMSDQADPALWSWTDHTDRDTAFYLSKMIVRPTHAGLGLGGTAQAWCRDKAARAGKKWLRGDVVADNPGLQRYYRNHGWEYIRRWQPSGKDFPLVWLVQRPVDVPYATGITLIER